MRSYGVKEESVGKHISRRGQTNSNFCWQGTFANISLLYYPH